MESNIFNVKVGNDSETTSALREAREEFKERVKLCESGSSGSDRMIVTVTNQGGTRTSDKFSDEIAAAYEAGMDVVAVLDDGYELKLHRVGSDYVVFQEINFEIDDERLKAKILTIADDSCDYRNKSYVLTEG